MKKVTLNLNLNNYSHNENLLKTVEEYNGEYEMSPEGLLTKEDGGGFHYFRLYDNTDELALSNNFISLGTYTLFNIDKTLYHSSICFVNSHLSSINKDIEILYDRDYFFPEKHSLEYFYNKIVCDSIPKDLHYKAILEESLIMRNFLYNLASLY